jgi:IclR family acetate operon transcriptional repressor
MEIHTELQRAITMKSQTGAPPSTTSGTPANMREARSDTVQSLIRALGLMNILARHDKGTGLSDLAKQSGLAVSTVHRLLSTLQRENFVRFEEARGVWTVGVQAFIVGSAFLRARELTGIAHPLMRQLMERAGETVNLAVEEDGEAIYLAQIECSKTMRAIARPGGRAAMHCSGVGKALLAFMSEEEVDRVIARHGLPAATARTITSPAKLKSGLKAIRARGYAVDNEENAVGLRCVAAPVFDETGGVLAALSLSGPTARIGDDLLPAFGNAVREAAAAITAGLGGVRPLTK